MNDSRNEANNDREDYEIIENNDLKTDKSNNKDQVMKDNTPNEESSKKEMQEVVSEHCNLIREFNEDLIQEIPLQSLEKEEKAFEGLGSDEIGKVDANWIDKQNNDNKIYEDSYQSPNSRKKEIMNQKIKKEKKEDITAIEGYIQPNEGSLKKGSPSNQEPQQESLAQCKEVQREALVTKEHQSDQGIDDEDSASNAKELKRQKDKQNIKETIRKERERYNNLIKKKILNYEKFIDNPQKKDKATGIDKEKPKNRNASMTNKPKITRYAIKKIEKNQLKNKLKQEEHNKSSGKEKILSRNQYFASSKNKLNQTGLTSKKLAASSKIIETFKDSEPEISNQLIKKSTRVSSTISLRAKAMKDNQAGHAPNKSSISYTNTIVGNSMIRSQEASEALVLPKAKYYSKRTNSVRVGKKALLTASKENSIIVLPERGELIELKPPKHRKAVSIDKSNGKSIARHLKEDTPQQEELMQTPVKSMTMNNMHKEKSPKEGQSLTVITPGRKGSKEALDSIEAPVYQELSDRIIQYQKNNEALLIKNSQLKERNDKMKADYDLYIDKMKKEQSELTKQFQDEEANRKGLESKIAEYETELQALLIQIESLSKEKGEQRELIMLHSSGGSKQTNEKEESIRYLKEELVISIQLLFDEEKKRKEEEEQTRERIEMSEALASKEGVISRLREEICQLETVNDLCTRLSTEKTQLEEQNKELTLEIATCLQQMKNEREANAIALSQQQSQIASLNATLTDNKQNEEKLHKHLASLQQESESIQSELNAEIDRLKALKASSPVHTEISRLSELDEKEIDEVLLRAESVPLLEKTIKELELKQKKLTITIESLIKALDLETKKSKSLKEKIDEMNSHSPCNSQPNSRRNVSKSVIYNQIKGPITSAMTALSNDTSISSKLALCSEQLKALRKDNKKLKAMRMKEKLISLSGDSNSLINEYIGRFQRDSVQAKLYNKIDSNARLVNKEYALFRRSFNSVGDLTRKDQWALQVRENYCNLRISYLSNVKDLLFEVIGSGKGSHLFTHLNDINLERQCVLIEKANYLNKVGSIKITSNDDKDDDDEPITQMLLNEESLSLLNEALFT